MRLTGKKIWKELIKFKVLAKAMLRSNNLSYLISYFYHDFELINHYKINEELLYHNFSGFSSPGNRQEISVQPQGIYFIRLRKYSRRNDLL